MERGIISGCEVQLVRSGAESGGLQVEDVRAVVEPEVVIGVRVSSSDHVAIDRG